MLDHDNVRQEVALLLFTRASQWRFAPTDNGAVVDIKTITQQPPATNDPVMTSDNSTAIKEPEAIRVSTATTTLMSEYFQARPSLNSKVTSLTELLVRLKVYFVYL